MMYFTMCRLNASASMGALRCSDMLVMRSRTDLMLFDIILYSSTVVEATICAMSVSNSSEP